GDLITTSNADSAAASGGRVTTASVSRLPPPCDCAEPSPGRDSCPVAIPSSTRASVALQNIASGWFARRRRNTPSAARPSRPIPQIATRLPASSSMRIDSAAFEHGVQVRRNAMRTGHFEQRREGEVRVREMRRNLVDEMRDDRILAPFGPRRERGHRGARLDALADAFERLVVAELEQRV